MIITPLIILRQFLQNNSLHEGGMGGGIYSDIYRVYR